MKLKPYILAVAIGAWALALPTRADDADPKALLTRLDNASKVLCQEISGSVVRVHVDQGVDYPPAWNQDYKDWRDKIGAEMQRGGRGGGGGHGRDNPPATMPANGAQPNPGGQPGPGGPGGGPGGRGMGGGFEGWGGLSFRHFLEEKLNGTQDAETIAKIRFTIQKMDAVRNGQGAEVSAVIIDTLGHALVLTPLQRDPKKPLQVTLPDGMETSATVTGVDLVRGLTIIKLEKFGPASSNLSDHVAEPGQILMGISANRNTVTLALPPIPGKAENTDDRFLIAGNEERGPTFFFDVTGKLMAISITGRQALPIASLAPKLALLIKGDDLIPTPIGIRYTDVTEKSPYRLTGSPSAAKLGERPAVHVDSVFKNSLAEKAGFKANDFIVGIDGKPLSPTFITNPSADLESRGKLVIFSIVREDKELDLEMHFDEKPDAPK